MKKIFYRLFAFIFNMSAKQPVVKNRVSLLAPHRGGYHDSLYEICNCLSAKGGFEINFISTADLDFDRHHIRESIRSAIVFFTEKARLLATSRYVFMNDNFMPMSLMNFSIDTTVVQLWHAEGAFKKFGLMTELSEKIEKNERLAATKLDYVVCSSKNVAGVYAEAFGVPESKVLPLGSPRTDFLVRGEDIPSLRYQFDFKHPECRGKKLILYAPTFRDDKDRDRAILSTISTSLFIRDFGDEYALLVKLHPQIHHCGVPESVTDVTDWDIAELTLICDMLITDYSSVCMDFALLSKPCIFFAYDLEYYENSRSFCFGYEDYVPGPVTRNYDELAQAIRNPRDDEKINRFREFNFDYTDSNNSERVVDFILSASRK